MAVLGKIRSKGALLVSIIGLGLFAFIAEEAVRSCESTKNNERQQIASVLGEKISYQEFQELVEEYQDVIKMTQGQETLNEDELNQVRDMVWNQYIQSSLIANEAKKVGLRVTDDEVRDILNQGTNPMLLQTPFVNQQTRRFDANILKQFISEYKKAQTSNPQQAEQMRTVYRYWTFMEKNLRQQLLAQKYQNLLAATFISNKVEAKQAYNEENTESDVNLAVLPYASVADKDIKVEDSDIKAKYDELKERFKQPEESRDIKYVSVKVVASSADRVAVNKQVADFAAQLAATDEPAELVRKSGSEVAYLGVPVLKTAFPRDIQNELDSIAVGATSAVKENIQDNTLNVVKLISKQELPDSVQFAIIDKDGKEGEPQWLTTAQYQNAPSMDMNTQTYLNTLNTIAVGETRSIPMTGDTVTVKVLDRKGMTTKYLAAVIKTKIDFTKDTYSAAYNKFSQYVSENQTLEGLENGAKKYGYQVMDNPGVRSGQHLIAGIHGSHEALKWVYEAEEGDVSPLYECGDNDNLLVVVLTKVNKKGYLAMDNAMIKDYLKSEVIKDKKAEKLIAKLAGVKSVAEAQKKGAQVVPVQQITFASPAFISLTGAAEPALSGAVAGTKAGKFSKAPVKGNGGVYAFQVTKTSNRGLQYDEKKYMMGQAQRQMQMAGNFMQELYLKANVTDNRYMFF